MLELIVFALHIKKSSNHVKYFTNDNAKFSTTPTIHEMTNYFCVFFVKYFTNIYNDSNQ